MAVVSQSIAFASFSYSYSARKTQTLKIQNAGVGSEKRRRTGIVAARPPSETAEVATEPLTKEDLIGFLSSGCKPRENWRVGIEHERFGFDLRTLRPMTYQHVAQLLHGIAERFGWEKIMEGENIIALKQGQQSVSLEPGGQFEHSGSPLQTLNEIAAEVEEHLYQVKAVLKDIGIGLLDIGCQPKWKVEDIPMMPKVSLDFSSEADMIRKMRASIALQPIATALFANSPFTEGKPNGYLCMRSQIYTDTDKDRTGMIPFVFDDSFGFERYVDYALDIPMYFIYRNKRHYDCTDVTFREFMAGKLRCIPGELPTLYDWEMHLGTIFPEVRLKGYLEMRGADAGPWRTLCGLPAFWVGILYDEVSLQNVLDMIADWTTEEREMLRNKVPKTGLKTPFCGQLLQHVAEDVVKFAKDGLERRGFNESRFLDEVVEVARTGVTPAEKLLELYYGKWGHNIDPVFEELRY